MPKELNGNDDITRDAALEELVADACESFILDENVIKTLQTIKTKDESLFGKIKEFFEKLFPIIPRLRKLYNGLANSRAGAEVKGWADGLERIRQAFAEGLAEASENFAYSEQKMNTDNGGKFEMRSPVEETGELIAVHNLHSNELLKSLQLGGLPMPSIAIIKAKSGHSDYGEISLVFGKETIDPENSSDNKVYGLDVWSPTYPSIEYKVNEKNADKIRKKYYELSRKIGYDVTRQMYNYANDLERVLNNSGGEVALLDKLYNDTDFMQLFLADNGQEMVDDVVKEVRRKTMSEADREIAESFIRFAGDEFISGYKAPSGVLPITHRKQFVAENEEKIKTIYAQVLKNNFDFTDDGIKNVLDALSTKDMHKLLRDALNYQINNVETVSFEKDNVATQKAIRDKVNQNEYMQWINDLFKGVEEKSGIRNNVDYFTPSGNRRSFEALHYENTLENVVKVMKSQENGASFSSVPGIWAIAAKKYGTIEEIKADSDRLSKIEEEDYSKIKQGFADRFAEIITSLNSKYNDDNPFIQYDNNMENVLYALKNAKTKSGLMRYLSEYFSNVSADNVNDLLDLIADIGNMPTGYFEAKPTRAVGVNEIKAAIIPDNSSRELKNGLSDAGVDFVEYENGNEESRLEKLNSLHNVKFSSRGFWHTGMSNAEVRSIENLAAYEAETTDNYIDNNKKWMYSKKNGKTYFAVYSISDINEDGATILYASKGKKAEYEHKWLTKYCLLEENDNGRGNNDKESGIISEILSLDKNASGERTLSNRNTLGTGSNVGNVALYSPTSGRRPSRALRNCLENSEEVSGSRVRLGSGGNGEYGGVNSSKKSTRDSEGKYTTKYSYEGLPADTFYKDGRIYDYDFLVAQKPIKAIEDLPSLAETKRNGKIDRDLVVEKGFANIERCGGIKRGNGYFLENVYTKKSLYITKNSITHGIGNNGEYNMRTNARLGCVIGEICQNAIPINAVENVRNVRGTYVMMGIANAQINGHDEHLVIKITVEQQNGTVLNFEVLDIAHAISGNYIEQNKKEENRAPRGSQAEGFPTDIALQFSSEYSIRDFLRFVNNANQKYLSDNVIDALKDERREEKAGLFSTREKPSYTDMAEMKALRAENEKLRDDIEGLEQLLKLQKEVTGGKIATTKAAGLAAGEMAQKYGVTMNKQNRAELTNQMSAAFAGISSLDEGFTFEDVQEAISPVASWIAEHSSDVTLDLDKLGVEADATEKAEIAEFMKARLIGAVTQDVYDAYWRASRLETVADKYQRKMNVLYSEHLAAMDKLRKKKKESLAKQKAHYQEVTDRLRNDKKEQKQKLAEQKEYYRDMVSRLRKAKNERIEETKKHASEMRQKGIESRRKTQLREKIKRIAEDFRTKKTLYT